MPDGHHAPVAHTYHPCTIGTESDLRSSAILLVVEFMLNQATFMVRLDGFEAVVEQEFSLCSGAGGISWGVVSNHMGSGVLNR